MIRASLYGRLGGDPQEKTTRNGAKMAVGSLAVNVGRPDADEDTEWFDLVAFGSTAKALLGHAKSDLVGVMGALHRRRYTARDGTARVAWSLAAESILSARPPRPAAGRKGNTAQQPSTPATASPEDGAPFDDDIPF